MIYSRNKLNMLSNNRGNKIIDCYYFKKVEVYRSLLQNK